MLAIIAQQGSLNKDIIRKREAFLNREIKNANIREARSISYLNQQRDRLEHSPNTFTEKMH